MHHGLNIVCKNSSNCVYLDYIVLNRKSGKRSTNFRTVMRSFKIIGWYEYFKHMSKSIVVTSNVAPIFNVVVFILHLLYIDSTIILHFSLLNFLAKKVIVTISESFSLLYATIYRSFLVGYQTSTTSSQKNDGNRHVFQKQCRLVLVESHRWES